MILSQLVEADEMAGLTPEELRELICRLDDEVVNGIGADPPVLPDVQHRGVQQYPEAPDVGADLP